MSEQRAGARAARAAVLSAVVGLLAAVGVWLMWKVFVDTYSGQLVDQAAVDGAVHGQTHLWRVAENVLDVVSVGFIAAVLVAAVLIAVLRRRWELAVQVALVMAGANLTTQLLKNHVFERPELGVHGGYGNTLPSGHTTAAASVSVALLLVVPPRARPWAALVGAGYTTATGVSTLIGQWHRPSDVLAAVLVVLGWTALTGALAVAPRSWAALRAPRLGRPALRSVPLVAGGLAAAGLLAGVAAVVALSRTYQDRGDLDHLSAELTAYAGGAAGVVMACFLVFAAVLLLEEVVAARLPHA